MATKCRKAVLYVMRVPLVTPGYSTCQEISTGENSRSGNTMIALIYKAQYNTIYTINGGVRGWWRQNICFICTLYPYVNAPKFGTFKKQMYVLKTGQGARKDCYRSSVLVARPWE